MSLYDEIKAGTNVVDGNEYRDIMRTIAKIAADLVVTTLGPYGSTTIIDDGQTGSYPSKDGWNCLSKLRFTEPMYNTAYGILRQVSFNSVSAVGDGTTTAMVGASAFLDSFDHMRATMGNFRQTDFLAAITAVKDEIIAGLKASKDRKMIDPDGSFDEIYRISYIATNGNTEVSKMIHKIYKETKNPNIHVAMGYNAAISYEIQNGYKFECQTLALKAYANTDGGAYHTEEPLLVAVFPNNITYSKHAHIINSLIAVATREQKTILLLAPYYDDLIKSIIESQIMKARQGGGVINVILGMVPATMEYHRAAISDIALLANTSTFDDAKVEAINLFRRKAEHPEEDINQELLQLEKFASFGSAEDILLSCIGRINELVLEEGYGFIRKYDSVVNQTDYDQVIAEATEAYMSLKSRANSTMNGSITKDYMDAYMRYVKLLGKTGIITVGGVSDVERRCLKDSIDDAVLACRSAYEYGYIRGLNLATIKELETLDNRLTDGEVGAGIPYFGDVINLFHRTFTKISMAVLNNKYPDYLQHTVYLPPETGGASSTICKQMANDEIIGYAIQHGYGFNLVNDTFERSDNLTVINSLNTDVQIISSISSILGLVMTSAQVVSTATNFDRKMTEQQRMAQEIERTTDIARAKAKTYREELAPMLEQLFRHFPAAEVTSEDGEDTLQTNPVVSQIRKVTGYSCKRCGRDLNDIVHDVGDSLELGMLEHRSISVVCPDCAATHRTVIYGIDRIHTNEYSFTCPNEECGADVAIDALNAIRAAIIKEVPEDQIISTRCATCGCNYSYTISEIRDSLELLSSGDETDEGNDYETECTSTPNDTHPVAEPGQTYICENCGADITAAHNALCTRYPEAKTLCYECSACGAFMEFPSNLDKS